MALSLAGRHLHQGAAFGTDRQRGSHSGGCGQHRRAARGSGHRHPTQRSRGVPGETNSCALWADRGLRGVKLIIADEHKGLKGAAAKVLGATIQRCRVHFMRNALACVGKKDRPIVTGRAQNSLRSGHAGRLEGTLDQADRGFPAASSQARRADAARRGRRAGLQDVPASSLAANTLHQSA